MSLVANEDFQHILRLLNTNVDGKQKITFAMTSIKGIGRRYANICCKKADIDMNKSSEEFLNFNLEDPPYDVIRTECGGEVTYHGPGQLVMYPIINLRNHNMDLHWYLRALEEVVIRVLFSTFSIEASQLKGFTGVWVGNQKRAAIAIRVSQWIAYHGLALNVSIDLTPFQQIVPCGLRDRKVGSIKQLLREFQASHHDSSMDQLGA